MFRITETSNSEMTNRIPIWVRGPGLGHDLAMPLSQVREGDWDSIRDEAVRLWGVTDDALLEKVIAEASVSKGLIGGDPAEWSPINRVQPEAYGRFESESQLATSLSQQVGEPGPGEASLVNEPWVSIGSVATGQPTFSIRVAGATIGAITPRNDSFIVRVGERVTSINITIENRSRFERDELAALRSNLQSLVPHAAVRTQLVWRLYLGSNTTSIDGVSLSSRSTHRIELDGISGVGYLVGRFSLVVSKRFNGDRPDISAPGRLARDEYANPELADGCPRLVHARRNGTSAVIAIHGTMGSAVDMARAIRLAVGADTRVLRFEHDTWIPVHHNGEELTKHIARLGLTEVVFVAYSRGGLIARHVKQELEESGVNVRVISLGSPFLGTRVVDVAAGALIINSALLGVLAHASPLAAAFTRIIGLVMGSKVPRGLEVMRPDSTYLSGFKRFRMSDTIAFAGTAEVGGVADNRGVAKGFANGVAVAAFGSEPNDFIVTVDSALGGVSPLSQRRIDRDHFSFLDDDAVREELARIHIPPMLAPEKAPPNTSDVLQW